MWWLLLAVTFAAACTPARRKVQTDVVKSIEFRGNKGSARADQNDYTLAGAMEQKGSSWGATVFPFMYWTTPAEYDEAAVDDDAWRLEIWYAHNGWLDARFEGWEVIRMRPRRSDMAGVVRLVGHVDPGVPSLVRAYGIEGLDRPVHRQFRNSTLRTAAVREGTRFTLDAVDQTQTYLLQLLANHGFPYARIVTDLQAYPEDHAIDVTMDVTPGNLSEFGEVVVDGNAAVRSEIVRDTMTLEPGQVYDARELAKSQQKIFSLGVFSVVNAIPDLSDPEQTRVPIKIRVSEAQFQTVRLGGGLSYRGATLTPRVSAAYRHVHLFNSLLKLDVKGSFGYGFRPRAGAAGLQDGTIVYSAEIGVSTPRVVSSNYGLYTSASVAQDVQSGQYTYFNPKARVGFTWHPTPDIVASIGPEFEFYEMRDIDREGLLVARQLFGEEFQNPYSLLKIAAQVNIDWRDDPISATRGTYYGLGVSQTLPVGGFLFTKLNGDVRLYAKLRLKKRTVRVPLSGALRLQAAGIIPWASNAYVPYPEKIFLGGANSLRGFLVDQVGPYDTICTHEPARIGDPFSNIPGEGLSPVIRHLPKGGVVSASTMIEARYAVNDALTAVLFTDVGMLLERSSSFSANSFRFGSGLGVRYNTSIGPIRVDLALRPLYAEDKGAAEIAGCFVGDDVLPRSYDAIGAIFPKQRVYDSRIMPLAVNVYLAIGEAF